MAVTEQVSASMDKEDDGKKIRCNPDPKPTTLEIK